MLLSRKHVEEAVYFCFWKPLKHYFLGFYFLMWQSVKALFENLKVVKLISVHDWCRIRFMAVTPLSWKVMETWVLRWCIKLQQWIHCSVSWPTGHLASLSSLCFESIFSFIMVPVGFYLLIFGLYKGLWQKSKCFSCSSL